MRDLVLFAIVFGLLPLVFKRPWIGALMWLWIGLMSPHRLTWGPAYGFPFASIIALFTLVGLFITKERRQLPVSGPVIVLMVFVVWMCITSIFALHRDLIGEMLTKVLKINLMLLVSLALWHTRRHVELILWVIVISVGFFGVKGGIFTLASGGSERVWGPGGSFIAGNNELALAMVMVVPLAYALYTNETDKRRKFGLIVMSVLSSVSVLGSQSRGGFLAISAMTMVLWFRSSQKMLMTIVLGIMGVGLLIFMPESWHQRMDTIQTYEQDGSAMGRINAWIMAWNLATDRWIGGGFELAQPEEFAKYAPNPNNPLAAHSIYFQVLGEHGFFGLFLFLLIWLLTWRMAGRIRKRAQEFEDTRWMVSIAGMSQVSLAGYAVGGAFLSLAYFDLPYYIMGVVVLCNEILKERMKAEPEETFSRVAPRSRPRREAHGVAIEHKRTPDRSGGPPLTD